MLVKTTDLGPLVGVGVAICLGMATGLFLSIPLARLRGAFQAIATVGFVQIMVSLAHYAEPITGGAFGLNGIPKVATTPWLLLALAIVATMLTIVNRGGVGRAFDAIRQDAVVAESLGISSKSYQRLSFAMSGALGGLGGCLLAYNTYSISPEEFGFPLLVPTLATVILGGRSFVAGPIIGAVVLLSLPEIARPLRDQRLLLQGLLLIAVIIYLPHGIVDSVMNRLRARKMRIREGM